MPRFLILGNLNVITSREVWPLVQDGRLRFGVHRKPRFVPLSRPDADYDIPGARWLTDLDHPCPGPLPLRTLAENRLRSSRPTLYREYDNYAALEVPLVDLIPSDHPGVLGVPISLMDKYCPDQIEIIGCSANGMVDTRYKKPHHKKHNEPWLDGSKIYQRIFIRLRRP
jgi:hypothetical protein